MLLHVHFVGFFELCIFCVAIFVARSSENKGTELGTFVDISCRIQVKEPCGRPHANVLVNLANTDRYTRPDFDDVAIWKDSDNLNTLLSF